MSPSAAPLERVSKTKLWTGWALSALPALFILTSAINLIFIGSPALRESFLRLGYSESIMPVIGVLEFVCVALYLIPQTSVLGAILLTGYLGGAIATHARVDDPTYVVPVVMGIVIWIGLYLRETRLGPLVPLRTRTSARLD